jgi:transposase
MSERLSLTRELTEALCARVDVSSLAKPDRAILKACVRYCLALGEAYAEKTTTIHKLLRMIFGPKTEKADKVIAAFPKKPKKERSISRGHGRNGAASYRGGKRVTVCHTMFKSGDPARNAKGGSSTRPLRA